MPSSPKSTLERFQRIINAWETLRPAKAFGGVTLTQFKDGLQPSLAVRDEIEGLEDQMSAALSRRDDADAAYHEQALLVVNAVKGDVTEGENGVLYEAMGYIRKVERKSGLTRRSQPAAAVR